MKKFVSTLCFFFAAAVVQAETASGQVDETRDAVVISTGVEGGGYWSAGERLRDVAAGLGLDVEVLESSGSRQNIARLLDPASPVSLAFAQADAITLYLERHPDAVERAEVLENIGEECVFVLTAIDSGLEDLGDLRDQAGDLTLHIGSKTSGVAATFDLMSELLPELAKSTVQYGENDGAMQALLSDDETHTAVMVVHRPRAHSPEVDVAIANEDKIQFVKLDEKQLQTKLSNGEPVYHSMRLLLPGASEPVYPVCVKGYLLASKTKLSLEQFAALQKLVNFQWMRVYATP